MLMQADLLPIIITEGGLRSGGVGRFDLAEGLNKQAEGLPQNETIMEKTITLTKCPDPDGSIDISLRYERLEEVSVAD